MNIFINDKPADITIDTEKTLGQVLSGIEQWVSISGNRIQGIKVDGKDVPSEKLVEVFEKNLNEIKRLDLIVRSWRELAAEALGELHETCMRYGNAPFDERAQIASSWEKSAASRFLSSDIPDIQKTALLAFSGEGMPSPDLALLIEERIRELVNTAGEIAGSEPLVKAIAARLEELPLDMQTGKDQHAAETIRLFSHIGEKLFRIFFIIYKSEGLSLDKIFINDTPANTFIDDFNNAVCALSSAYGNQDMVAAGDIAEYELAPLLVNFHNALNEAAKSNYEFASLT